MQQRRPEPDTVEDVLARQDRTISRRQVRAAGKSARWWDWKLTQHWQRAGDGVAIAHLGTPDPSQLEWAALLHCGPGAALSGDLALVHVGVKGLVVVEHQVAVPADGWANRMQAPLLVVAPHRASGMERWSAGHPLLRLVHVHAAVLHAAAWAASDEQAERRLAMTVQQRKSTPMSIRAVLQQMPLLRRRALLAEVHDDIELGATASSELDFLRFCRRHRLPEPDQLQVAVRAGGLRYLDARYRRQRLRVELDGGHHRWVQQWEADTLRSLHLVVQAQGSGEQQIRLTRGMMRHHEQEVAGLLRQLLL